MDESFRLFLSEHTCPVYWHCQGLGVGGNAAAVGCLGAWCHADSRLSLSRPQTRQKGCHNGCCVSSVSVHNVILTQLDGTASQRLC